MLRVVKGAGIATAASFALVLGLSANALAAPSPVAFTPCAGVPGFGCAHLTVPLDPGGSTPGTVTLSIERKVAVTGTATTAVVGLTGGPGQSAIPFASYFAQTMSAGLATRDLIVFDQRGTGASGALSCPALAKANTNNPSATLVNTCGTQLGSTRGDYTTDDSVADIEAIREALGYSQLVIYGTSYGTKVALRYAEEHPAQTAGLVLDSTVEPNGPSVYGADTFAAIPGMLSELCAANACAGIGDPMSDLTTVVTRLNAGPVHTNAITSKGRLRRVKLTSDDVFNVMISGDLDPLLRANLPAALHAAAHRDYALLAALSVIANAPEGGVDTELYLATVCEELPFPWTRGDTPTTLAAQALSAFEALPSTTFAPFTSKTAYDESDAPNCAGWPFATAAPESTSGTLPNVPALIISGEEDMRTPTADAAQIAAAIPDATLLKVPNTGHSVLGTEPTSCAQSAVNAFFKATPIAQCTNTTIPSDLQPTPVPPRTIAQLHLAPGTSGLPGKTVTAVFDTLEQSLGFGYDEFLSGSSLSATARFGGLRSGRGSFSLRGLRLRAYSYIPGVQVSGFDDALTSKAFTLTVRGSRAASGELTFSKKDKTITGTVGGVSISTTEKALQSAAGIASASAASTASYDLAQRLGAL